MKKEAYLHPHNMDRKNLEWQNELVRIKTHFPFSINSSKVALLVLDMQDIFLNEDSHAYIPSSPSIIPNIKELVSTFSVQKSVVIFTRHLTSKDEQDVMFRWWRNPILESDPMSKITNMLDTSKVKILQKNQYSAFFSTDLKTFLQKKGIKQVIITGVMTHLCCETTARDAFMNGFEVFFAMDATAAYTEELHLGTLRSITHGFGRCLPTTEIIKSFHTEVL
ncbi:isochorismatase family protein [Candidatus Lokiarchaeum ossiferum]|uniref:isochorismatase family protein n=1 Tax=Candidatus Lokiarchaeum ossiferum TaxID=2951803 RepID=UPI00352F2FEF